MLKIKLYLFNIILALCLMLSLSKIHAQQTQINALQKEYPTLKSDSERVINLSYIAFAYSTINTDSAMAIIEKGLNLAFQIDFERGIASCYNTLGWIYYKSGDNLKGIEYIQKAIKIDKALKLEKELLINYFNLSSIYLAQETYDEALSFLLQALPLSEKYPKSELMSGTYKNLAIVYRELKNYDESIIYFEKAIELNLKNKSPRFAADIKVSLGILYVKIGKYEEAEKEYKEANALSTKDGDIYGQSISLENLGDLYFLQKKYDRALASFTLAKKGYVELQNDADIAYINLEIAKLYSHQKKYRDAILQLNDALEIVQKTKARNYKQEILDQLSLVFEQVGDYEKAFNYFKSASGLKDSIKTEAQQSRLDLLYTKFETEKKDKQISILTSKQLIEAQKSKVRILFFSASILLLIIIAGIVYTRSKFLKKKAIISEQKLKITQQQRTELEQRLLRSQMNPHFIFNCLNTIDSFVLQNKKVEATLLIQRFAKLTRRVLDFSARSSISTAEEIDLLKFYLLIEQTRQQNAFEFRFIIHDEQLLKAQIPPMIIQPFVENALLHGIRNRGDKEGKLNVILEQGEGCLKFTIEDNGIGRAKAKMIKDRQPILHKSKSMDITKERLAALHPKMELSEYLVFTDYEGEKTGTSVEIYLPLLFNEEVDVEE